MRRISARLRLIRPPLKQPAHLGQPVPLFKLAGVPSQTQEHALHRISIGVSTFLYVPATQVALTACASARTASIPRQKLSTAHWRHHRPCDTRFGLCSNRCPFRHSIRTGSLVPLHLLDNMRPPLATTSERKVAAADASGSTPIARTSTLDGSTTNRTPFSLRHTAICVGRFRNWRVD